MEIALVKQMNNSLVCAFDSDYEVIKKLKLGQVYFFNVKKERNPNFHRKFFALVKMVYENQDHYNNLDKLRKDLIVSAGFYDEHVTFFGETIQEAKSISFSRMEEDEFQELYNRVIDEIVKYFHFDKQKILDHIEQFF